MNPKLEAIADKASADLLQLIKEGEEKILEAWNACEQEAQDNETKPKFKLSLGITLDLDADSMETALTFGIKHKLSVNATMPDPNQGKLPLSDIATDIKDMVNPVSGVGGISSLTISSGGKSVVIDKETAKNISANCDKILKGKK